LSGVEVVRSSNLILGVCSIDDKSLRVLFDYEATHSFVLSSCVEELEWQWKSYNLML